MKSVLTILFSLVLVVSMAQQRVDSGPKPIEHGPLACPAFVMTNVDGTTITPSDLVEAILGPDIQSYANVSFLGLQGNPDASAGLFTGGVAAGIGIEEGIILSSGFIRNAVGPNTVYVGSAGITGNLGTAGDAQLTALAGFSTLDATVLQFDFVPNFEELFIEFVFGSEEYNYYVNSVYNDVFAFYLNGTNIALVPSTTLPVTINNVNNGLNAIYYKDNDDNPAPTFCTEMNGFTTVVVATGLVNTGVTNTIKLAIADNSDRLLDSWVLIKAESFGGTDPEVPVSNWALFIGIGLILAFAVIRFRRLV